MTPAGAEREALVRGLGTVWWSLPSLLLWGAPVAAVLQCTRIAPALAGPAVLLTLPVLIALVSELHGASPGEPVGTAAVTRRLPAAARATALHCWPAAAAALVTGLAFHAAVVSGQGWMSLSVGVGIAVTAVLGAVGLIAAPLAAIGGLAPRAAWRATLHRLLLAPVAAAGPLAAVVLAAAVASYSAFPVLLLIPAVLTPVWSAALASAGRRVERATEGSSSTAT